MLLTNMKIASICNGIFLLSFLRRLVLLFLTIAGAIYFMYVVQPMDIFHNKRELPNTMSVLQSATSESGVYREKANASSLEDEYETINNMQVNNLIKAEDEQKSGKTDQTSRIKVKLFKEVELVEKCEMEKKVIEANITVYQKAFTYMSSFLHNTPYPGVENYTRYAMARLGMIPLYNVERLKPEFGPAVNDFLSFRYRISVPPCHSVSANRSIFIAVNSAPGNFDKRNIIRQTWRKHIPIVEAQGLMGLSGFAFILGLTNDNVTQTKIDEENNANGDIIQIEMSDFYRNLSLKVAGMFNWLYRNCAKVDFVMKTDDDVYVNVRNLAHFVQSNDPSKQSIFGTAASAFTANRVGKWTISFEEWPWTNYPSYFFGPAIVLPQSTITPLFAASQTIPLMPIDDVYLTGICTEKAKIKLRFSSNSFTIFNFGLPDGCHLRRVLSWLTENLIDSHVAVENFYSNSTHNCIETYSNGTKVEVGHNVTAYFSFN